MSKHNYSQYSKRDSNGGAPAANAAKNRDNNPKQTATNTKPAEVKMEQIAEAFTPMLETVEAACPPKTVAGVVANCAKLNVRSKPSITGEIVCVLNASSEIEIDVEKSVTDWVYICTATGVEGYCMRQFIKSDM